MRKAVLYMHKLKQQKDGIGWGVWPNGPALYSGQHLSPTASWKGHGGVFYKLTNWKWTEEPILISAH